MTREELIAHLNLRLHETMPINQFSCCVRKDDGLAINYLEEHWNMLFVEVRCRLVPGARLLVHIPEEELPVTEENRLSIGSRIGQAVAVIERHAFN